MNRIAKILTMAALLVPVPLFTARAAEVTLTPAAQTVAPGDTFSVALIVALSQGEALAGGVIDLGYDDTVVEILQVVIDEYWDFMPDPGEKNTTDDGLWEGIGFDAFVNNPATESALIATIGLKALAAGTSGLEVLSSSQFYSASERIFPTLYPASIRVNTPPVADEQTLETAEDAPIAVTLSGTDAEGDSLVFTVLTGPPNGVLGGAAPNLTYTPAADFNGTDSFTYMASDPDADSGAATVTITVSAVNDAPTAEDLWLTTTQGAAATVTLSGSDIDGDSLVFTVLAGPSNGVLGGTAPDLTYSPGADFNGTDSFTYKTSDGALDSNPATVTITVTALNPGPVVNAGADQSAAEGAAVTFAGSFTDPGTDGHTILWQFGDGGTAAGTLTPAHTYADNGVYTVLLTVTDDTGAAGADTLTVTVSNVAPTLIELDADTVIRTGETILALCAFTDPGDDTWSAEIDFGDGVQETLALEKSTDFSFTHAYSAVGLHSLDVIISDDDGGKNGDGMAVAVTGDSDCIRGKGFWAHQFSDDANRQVDDALLQRYLYIVSHFSKVFSETVSVASIEDARQVFWWTVGEKKSKDQDATKKAEALEHLLDCWLNFADGAFSLDATLGKGYYHHDPEMTSAEAIAWAENILNDPDSDKDDFIDAINLCESVNNMGACK